MSRKHKQSEQELEIVIESVWHELSEAEKSRIVRGILAVVIDRIDQKDSDGPPPKESPREN